MRNTRTHKIVDGFFLMVCSDYKKNLGSNWNDDDEFGEVDATLYPLKGTRTKSSNLLIWVKIPHGSGGIRTHASEETGA